MTVDYSSYEHLLFERRDNGVLTITLNRPDVLNAANAEMHTEMAYVWNDVARDRDTRVAVVTGAGTAFSAGGDLQMVEDLHGSYDAMSYMATEAADLVLNMLNCPTPIISAINGTAVGAGLAVALMADISVIGEDVRFTDGHIRLGVGAGDHAVLIWPLLCGMAKAKYYLMTAEFIDGREAERIGLCSRCVPRDEVLAEANRIADKLAAGPQDPIRWTKRTLNHWLRPAIPAFDASLAYEMLAMMGPDVNEGARAIREKRPPTFS
jgi:enoyl-CoA hydratase